MEQINPKLIQTENQLKEIVESGEPKSIMYDGKKYYMSKKKIKEIRELIPEATETTEKEGGILPLVALLPLIFGGITAASASAAAIASTVKDSKIAALASKKAEGGGKGMYLNPYEGKALNDFFKSKGISVKKNGVAVFKGSSGIYLKPFTNTPNRF